MNDDTDKPLNTVGDDALEARITAWVLGEASSFEAGELEKLCAADPALRLFERRLRVLHGLVAEDFKAGPATEWKLSAARRAKITDMLGVEPVVEEVLPRRKRSRGPSVRGLILALAACVVIGVASFALLGGVGSGAKYAVMKESARIVSYSAAPAPEAMAQVESLRSEPGSLRLEREGGAPVKKPDTSYAHLGTNSPFSSKPPPPALPASAADPYDIPGVSYSLPANETQPAARAKRMAVTDNAMDPPAEAAPEIAARTNADFIPPVGGATIPGVPAATESSVTDIITAGNRSGDAVISRNNIDAILNHPNQPAKSEGERIAGLTGTFTEMPATPGESLDGRSDATTLGLDAGIANGPTDEFLTRNPAAGGAAKGGVAGRAHVFDSSSASEWRDPAAESRYAMNLRAGSERTLQPGESTSFGDLEEMGRLAGETRSQQGAGLGYYHSRTDSQAVDGIADLSDLARKQQELIPPPAMIGGLKRDLSLALESAPVASDEDVRAQLLEEVDRAWEFSVPPAEGKVATDPAATDDPIRTNPALAPEDGSKVDEVRRKLYIAEGNQNLGKFDDARKVYEEVLRIDPYNKAARRGMEKVAAAKSDYYRAAYDQTRAELLMEVDEVLPETKKQIALDLMSEVASADEPFSTFSLHVSDASFKLAHAAMERGEVPAAEGIRPEEFYNAFDYGDPAPASGEPVVCVTEQSAHPAFAQRNLLRIGVRTGSQGRGASTPLNLTLLLDHSGSMEREDRNAGLANAVRQLSSLLKEGDTITVAGFSRQPRLLADRLPGARAEELNELIARTPSEGGTNLEEGLKLAEELAKRQFNPAAQNRVVLFTDGAANLGDARPEALQARIEGLRQQGIAFDAAGFGADGLNDKLLERLTRNGNGRYYVVDGPEDADAGFAKQLAGAFRPAAENVKVQVRFNPARVAKYKLIGFEEHRLQKEDFRNDAVDAAEMAAEEAGNALYQIETLPQGEGEVGEVSVRFRDVASGQMVERTWTIPYDAQAPAFDRATPSIQLAGLAAFTAEKLRAAPMADAVDFQQLGQVFAGVRARYPNSQPVADLGSMIGKMK